MIGVKNDNLDALILLSAQVLEESNLSRFAAADTADTVRPASLDRKVRRLIRQEQHARRAAARWTPVKRVVAAILIFCTVAFAAAMSIEAVRGAVWQAIVRWYDTYIAVSFEDADAVPKTIRTKHEPTDVPSDWVREVRVDSQILYRIVYRKEGKKMLSYKQQPLENQAWANKADSTTKEVFVGDRTATLVTSKDTGHYTLYWSDGAYQYTLQSISNDITLALMVQIAAFVK
ncbi:MAG: DUF4367 domain-containing protein [Clostridiales bacterium]|nr:DUF4367 domain-containing protein [Clostridiales bacterium]